MRCFSVLGFAHKPQTQSAYISDNRLLCTTYRRAQAYHTPTPLEGTRPRQYERQVSRQQGVYSKSSTITVPNDSCLSTQTMGPKKEPPHKRRDSVMSLQPVQQLWTACPCKTLCKVCDSSRVGSVRFIGPIRLQSVLGSLRSCGGRAALLVTAWSVACMPSRARGTDNTSRALSLRGSGAVRGCSHFLSRFHTKKAGHPAGP